MTNNKPNDVRVVPVELLEELLDAAKWKAADFTKASPYRSKIDEVVRRTKDLLTQPADQQGEPIALSEDVREYLQEGMENATGCEDSDVDYDFAEELAMLLGPIYRHAQPATAKVVLPERLDLPHRDEFESADQHAAAVGEAKTWNACLDEVAKLNAPQ